MVEITASKIMKREGKKKITMFKKKMHFSIDANVPQRDAKGREKDTR